MPQISIIVPVYNVEKYLNRCIESILGQIFTDFELILVDDGSTDSCPQMCDNWANKDERIIVIHQKNGGLSAARNSGLKIYRGNYVFFVDSDDWIEKDALETLYKIADKTGADIVVGNHRNSSDYCIENKKFDISREAYSLYNKDEYLDMYLKITSQKTRYYAWAKLYSSKVASYIHYSEGYTSEDVEGTFYAIANASLIAETDHIVYHYFFNSMGISQSTLKSNCQDMYHSWRKVISYSEEKLPEYVEKCEYNLMRIDLPVLIQFIVKPIDKGYKEYLNDLKTTKKRLNMNYLRLMSGALPYTKKVILTICRVVPTEVFCLFARIKL